MGNVEYVRDDADELKNRPFSMGDPEPPRPPLHLMSYRDMQKMPDPEPLISGVIYRRTAALLYGKSNSFKTFLSNDMGLSVATGTPWHGHDVVKGRVLFVATEGAIGVGKMRLPAWYDHHRIPERDRNNAFLYPKEINLDKPNNVTDVIAAMKAIGDFELVDLDIFGGTMAGSEIEDTTARAWVNGVQRIIRETSSAVLAIAHTGWKDETRARMHTHFWGSFDSRMRVEGDKDALTTTLTIERHKDADSSGSWGFNLVPSGRSLVPVLDDDIRPAKTAKKPKGSGTEQIAIDALMDALEAHGEIKTPPKHWPNSKVVKLDHWRAECVNHKLCSSSVKDSQDKAFNRALDKLQEGKKVRVYRDHAWLCFD